MSVRVHELAKELGIESVEVLSALRAIGCYTKSASSTVEADDVRRLRAHLDGELIPPQSISERIRPIPQFRRETLDLEAARLKRESQRGKRHRGDIDVATQHFLDSARAHKPPFLDEYAQARARTDEWLMHGFVSLEVIVRWETECPGISPSVGVDFIKAGLTPRHARTRWDGRKIDPEGETMIYRSMSPVVVFGREVNRPLTIENAVWLLQKAGLAS